MVAINAPAEPQSSALQTAATLPSASAADESTSPSPTTVAIASTTVTTETVAAKQSNNSPPPLEFIHIDPNQRLPRPPLPLSDGESDLMRRAEEMIRWAISSKHENSPSAISAANKLNNPDGNSSGITMDQQKSILKAAQSHQTLTKLLSRKSSPPLLHATLHAIVSSNSGRNLDRLVTNSKVHAQLFHLIMKFDPFLPPSATTNGDGTNGEGVSIGLDKLRDLDRVRHERKKAEANSSTTITATPAKVQKASILQRVSSSSSMTQPTPRKAKIAESSIRHKENAKYLSPALPYITYQIADTYLYLLITLISNNSILSMSAIRSVWGLLTDFGSRWGELEMKNIEEDRKERRRQRQMRAKLKMLEIEERKKKLEMESKEEEADGPPPCKRQKTGNASSPSSKTAVAANTSACTPIVSNAKSAAKTIEAKVVNNNTLLLQQAPPQQLENEKPVPGMAGLSVEFVRDAFAFYNDEQKNENGSNTGSLLEEGIYSDRLASGRVQRLLLTILNIIRLCPRSKSSLQQEMLNNFPHYKTAPPKLYMWYTHMCLQMVHLLPTLEGPVLCMFVDKGLDMDVEIKIGEGGLVCLDEGGRDEDDIEAQLESIASSGQHGSKKRTFQQISQGNTIASAADKSSNESILALATNAKDEHADDEADHIFEMSERLDTLMTLLYERIVKVTSYDANSLPSAMSAVVNARRIYRHLDEVFDRKVRTTDRSKFVQFAFFVLFGRENDALECVGQLMAAREQEQQEKEHSLTKRDRSQSLTKDEIEIMANNTVSTTGPINVMDPLYRSFSAKLIDLFFNPNHAGDVPRQTVVCYLASFVSRATYVCPETVCECLAALLRWAEVYISVQSTSKTGSAVPASSAGINGGGNSRRLSSAILQGNTKHPCEIHALFYTACQAAFYITCFRGAEAIKYYRQACKHQDDPESPYADPDSVDISPARWKALCGHAMQPLKYCLESVRLEFLNLAEDLELFLEPSSDDNGIEEAIRKEEEKKFLEKLQSTSSPGNGKKQHASSQNKTKSSTAAAANKRKRSKINIISTAATQEKKRLDGGVGGLGRGSNPLGSFFPFDPYLLQKSYQHVHPYYRNWEDCILTLDGNRIIAEAEGINYDCGDAHSDVSDMEEEEGDTAGDEEDGDDSDDNDEDEEEEDHSHNAKTQAKSAQKASPTTTAATGFVSIHEDNHFEMEIRRSRAMSTGSQCSW